MESIVNKIESRIKKCGRGKIYFPDDFAALGTPDAVRKSLARLEKSGLLVRVARGIYVYPEIDKKLGLGVIRPGLDSIAKMIAKRDNARIVPTGAYALNALGLSTQVVVNVVYLTDGSPRRISIGNGRGILFKHTAPNNLAYKSDLVMLVVSALKEIGEGRMDDNDYAKIKNLLTTHEKKEVILQDLRLAPIWIRKIILSMI